MFKIFYLVAPIELASAKKEKESAQRQLVTLREDHERMKQMMQTNQAKLAEKTIDLETNREKMLELQEQVELLKQERDDTIAECNRNVDIWTAFGKKYYTWYSMANTQLESVKLYIDNDGKFENDEEVTRLNAVPRQMYRALEQFDYDDETVEELGSGSLLEYEGVSFATRRPPSPETEREIARADQSAANFTLPRKSGIFKLLFAGKYIRIFRIQFHTSRGFK